MNGKIPAVPDSIIDELQEGVTLRNQIIHSGVGTLAQTHSIPFWTL